MFTESGLIKPPAEFNLTPQERILQGLLVNQLYVYFRGSNPDQLFKPSQNKDNSFRLAKDGTSFQQLTDLGRNQAKNAFAHFSTLELQKNLTATEKAELINLLDFSSLGWSKKQNEALRASFRSRLLVDTARKTNPGIPWQKTVSQLREKEPFKHLSALKALDLALADRIEKLAVEITKKAPAENPLPPYQNFMDTLKKGVSLKRRDVLGGLTGAAVGAAFALLLPKLPMVTAQSEQTNPEPTNEPNQFDQSNRFSREQLFQMLIGKPPENRPAGHSNLSSRTINEPEIRQPEASVNEVLGLEPGTQVTITGQRLDRPIRFKIVENPDEFHDLQTAMCEDLPQIRPENVDLQREPRRHTGLDLHSSHLGEITLPAQELLDSRLEQGDLLRINDRISIVYVGTSNSILENQYNSEGWKRQAALDQAEIFINKLSQNHPLRLHWENGAQLVTVTTCDPEEGITRYADGKIKDFNNRLIMVFLVWDPRKSPLPPYNSLTQVN